MEHLQEMHRPFFQQNFRFKSKSTELFTFYDRNNNKNSSLVKVSVFSVVVYFFPFNLIGAAFTDYTLLLFYHLPVTEEKRETNVAPSTTINGIWVHVPHICTCCQIKGGNSCNNNGKCKLSFSFKLFAFQTEEITPACNRWKTSLW